MPPTPSPTPVPTVTPEMPSGTWRALLALLARLPQGALSRGFGAAADVQIPRALRPAVLGGFARAVGIDLGEAELPLVEYPTLNAFFVRRLKPGVREWPGSAAVAGSPVDGVVGQVGRIEGEGRLVQAKGRLYSAAELLDDAEAAARYQGGTFATIYLSPRHYHRIHAPVGGSIPMARHVPGALLPVNAAAVAHIPDLFAKNERLICYLDTEQMGRVAAVAVGAYNVGRISAAFDPRWNVPEGESGWVTNRGTARAETRSYAPAVPVAQGGQIMAFHLGSTVVLLWEAGCGELAEGVVPGAPIRLGAPLLRVG